MSPLLTNTINGRKSDSKEKQEQQLAKHTKLKGKRRAGRSEGRKRRKEMTRRKEMKEMSGKIVMKAGRQVCVV